MKLIMLSTVLGLAAGTALASDLDLPKQLSWSAYGTGSGGYNQAVAMGAALQEATGVNLRILPGKNDVARLEPLRQRKVQFSASGIGMYFVQEAVFAFAGKNWGPQSLRVLAANNGGGFGLTVGIARDVCGDLGKPDCAGVTFADLKGKRVAWVKGAPALNIGTEAMLAFGGLTWDDVEKVEFGGFAQSWKGFVEGKVDAAFAGTNSGKVYEAASGPRGLYWPEVDVNDTAALERMQNVAPYFTTMRANVGATLDGTDGIATTGYAYPILITYADQDEDLVYNMTKAVFELFPEYDGDAPGIGGWAFEKQDTEWVVPYHDGAIRYFKEAGAWSDAAQANNDRLIARQEALIAAWEELEQEDPDDWEAAWAEKRRATLKAGDFPVSF